MAFYWGPKVITDGLVLYLDAANPKSYVDGSDTWYSLVENINIDMPSIPTFDNDILVFDDDYGGTLQTLNNLDFRTDDFTLSVFASLSDFSTYHMYPLTMWQSGALSGNNSWLINFRNSTSTKSSFAVETDNVGVYATLSVGATTPILLNVIYEVTATRSNDTIKIYVNGVHENTTTDSRISIISNTISSTLPLYIGAFGGGNTWTTVYSSSKYRGKMSTIKIYNRALNEAEVLQNYDSIKGRFGL